MKPIWQVKKVPISSEQPFGAPCILTGANEYLGWTHTVNYPTRPMYFKNEKQDHICGWWRGAPAWRKSKNVYPLLGLANTCSQDFYQNIYGPAKKQNWRFCHTNAEYNQYQRPEQWWRMNKARSFSEFYSYLEWNALPGYNIGYDRNDTIFYISNGKFPDVTPITIGKKPYPVTQKHCGILHTRTPKSSHPRQAMSTMPITVHLADCT